MSSFQRESYAHIPDQFPSSCLIYSACLGEYQMWLKVSFFLLESRVHCRSAPLVRKRPNPKFHRAYSRYANARPCSKTFRSRNDDFDRETRSISHVAAEARGRVEQRSEPLRRPKKCFSSNKRRLRCAPFDWPSWRGFGRPSCHWLVPAGP